eukprot:7129574-Heterocapsa_arctica.AAC.1
MESQVEDVDQHAQVVHLLLVVVVHDEGASIVRISLAGLAEEVERWSRRHLVVHQFVVEVAPLHVRGQVVGQVVE